MDKIQKTNAQYYEKNAEKWAARPMNLFWHEGPFRKFLARLGGKGTVLDVGCAAGFHVPLFLGIGRKLKYEGLDISRKFLKVAKSRYPQLPFRYGNIVDAKTLPRKKYDGFWAVAVLQHIPREHWPQALENLERLTKRGGIGYFTLPDTRPAEASQEDPRYFEIFSNKEVRKMLALRKWRITDSGELYGRTGNAVWRWYIVRLP